MHQRWTARAVEVQRLNVQSHRGVPRCKSGPGSEVDEDWMRESNCILLRSCRNLSIKVIVSGWALVKMSVAGGSRGHELCSPRF